MNVLMWIVIVKIAKIIKNVIAKIFIAKIVKVLIKFLQSCLLKFHRDQPTTHAHLATFNKMSNDKSI